MNLINLYIHFSSDLYDIKYPIELNCKMKSKNENLKSKNGHIKKLDFENIFNCYNNNENKENILNCEDEENENNFQNNFIKEFSPSPIESIDYYNYDTPINSKDLLINIQDGKNYIRNNIFNYDKIGEIDIPKFNLFSKLEIQNISLYYRNK